MNPIDYHEIVDVFHEHQNPTTTAKLDQVINYCDVQDGQRVLDVGCGKGWFLRRLATQYAISGLGIDLASYAIREADKVANSIELRGQLEFQCLPAGDYMPHEASWDLGVCIGASFAIGSFEDLLDYLTPAVKPGGLLVLGDIYAKQDPMPAASARYFAGGALRTLADTADMLNSDSRSLLAIVDSSQDDWDHYENLHWTAADKWLRENPHDPRRDDFVQTHNNYRREHYRHDRAALGWALFVVRVG